MSALFDANNVAGLFIDSYVDQIDDLLGLTGTALAHNNLNHNMYPPVIILLFG
jgi:hypothetical protein